MNVTKLIIAHVKLFMIISHVKIITFQSIMLLLFLFTVGKISLVCKLYFSSFVFFSRRESFVFFSRRPLDMISISASICFTIFFAFSAHLLNLKIFKVCHRVALYITVRTTFNALWTQKQIRIQRKKRQVILHSLNFFLQMKEKPGIL